MSEACGILLCAEDGDLVVRAPESLHALIGLLSIVEGWCHAMQAKIGVGDKYWR